MRSHLTRYVFRRLLANEPILHRGCLRRHPYSNFARATRTARIPAAYNGIPTAALQQKRSFFNLTMFTKKQEQKEPDMDPGIEKMMELAKRKRMRARMPPIEDVGRAIAQFFNPSRKLSQPITDTQAQLLLQSLGYYLETLQELGEKDELPSYRLNNTTFRTAAKRLVYVNEVSPAHCELARLVYEQLITSGPSSLVGLEAYVKMLSLSGSPRRARDLVLQCEQDGKAKDQTDVVDAVDREELEDAMEDGASEISAPRDMPRAWQRILKGFSLEDDAHEVRHTLRLMEERGSAGSRAVAAIMLEFSVRHDDLNSARRWWNVYRERALQDPDQSQKNFGQQLDKILKWCLANGQIEAGHEIVKEVMTSINPPKPLWDAIFVWAAGTKKSVDEIDRMIDVMEKSNEAITDSDEWRKPDIATINGLVEYAISQNDPYMAERFISLGRDRNIEPDARTYVLQMDYRLSVGDVDGALIAYKNLQSMDLSSDEDVPTVNRMIVALCKTQRHDFDTIMNVAADLSDRRVRFEPEAVTMLSLLHLNRDEEHDVIDLLNTHAFHFSSGERESVRDAIIIYTRDPNTPTSRAWQGYNIVRTVFDETPRGPRTELMSSFFNRRRADMGVRIFQQMRAHNRADVIPTVDTYADAFLALAKLRDLESVEVVHNLLKLDYNINVTTYLRNALIIAYTACDKGRKALGFWDEIVASKEGPSYNSIHVALRACEKSPFGDLRAKELWSLLRRRNVELDQALWASYVAALAGNGDNDLAITSVEEAEEQGELEVDSFLLGSLFAGASGQIKQGEIESWAMEKYPEVWQQLEDLGSDSDVIGMKSFKIDRRVSP